MPQPDGSLLVYEYSGKGLQPVAHQPKPTEDLGTIEFLGTKVVNARPVLKTWGVGSPARGAARRADDRARQIYVHQADEARRNVSDPGRLSGRISRPAISSISKTRCSSTRWTRAFSYSAFNHLPNKDRVHFALQYKTLNWDLQYLHNSADFYDLFGPVERSRRGDVFIVGWKKTTIYDPPRQLDLFWNAGGLLRPRTLPIAQNVT